MKKHIPLFLLLAMGGVFILIFYGKAITHANTILFSNSGDAIKNYFTYAYHIIHDKTYVNFEGMNYPYGEHFLYTDCHPVLANTLKLISSKLQFIKTHIIGILNFTMIFSIFLTFIICYFLLLEFRLNKWLSVLFSISITLLAPQISRLGGHLSLSYSIAIPLSWLLLLKSFKRKNSFTIILFINTLFWFFIHAYLGVIIVFFLITIIIIKIITDKNSVQQTIKYILLIGTTLLPVIVFFLFSLLTDGHIDRTTNPSGFFLYNAEFDDVFLPHHGPFKPILDKLTGNIIKLEWEAWSYVGLATTALFLGILILLIIKLVNREKHTGLNFCFRNKNLNISLISAFIVLLFAMGFPFKQIPWLLEYFPVLKQFRATGRFTWPFFFVATVFSAFVFHHVFFRLKNKKSLLYAILVIFAYTILNCMEAIPFHIGISKSISKSLNLFKADLLPVEYKNVLTHIKPGKYQAIFVLPFYYLGSESFSRPRNEDAVRASIVISYHTGIPIICSSLARTSISESKKIVQLVSPDYYEKEIVNDFPNDKPILLIKVNSSLTKYENDILHKGKLIYSGNKIEIFSLDLNNLFKSGGMTIYKKFQQQKSILSKRGPFYVSDSNSFLFYNGFEKLTSGTSFCGEGAFGSIKKGKNIFAEFEPNTFSEEKEYQVSIWMYNGEPDALNLWFRFLIEEYDELNNIWYSTTIFPEYSETINGDWSLIEGVFKIKNTKNKVYIVSKGKENSKALLHADDLLIQEVGTDVYRLEEEKKFLFYNNQRIKININEITGKDKNN